VKRKEFWLLRVSGFSAGDTGFVGEEVFLLLLVATPFVVHDFVDDHPAVVAAARAGRRGGGGRGGSAGTGACEEGAEKRGDADGRAVCEAPPTPREGGTAGGARAGNHRQHLPVSPLSRGRWG